jgi:cytochrome c peroxidase
MVWRIALGLLMSGFFCSAIFVRAQSTSVNLPVEFQLSQHCPPSFELTSEGQCKLVSFYQRYDSVQHKGLGGTQTALPAYRDGFSPEKIDLGRYLFFDPLLSGNHTLSCASCHQIDKGLSDGLDRSIGIQGQKTARGAPTLWNVGFLQHLFWDSRSESLEDQAQGPLFAADEMGNTAPKLLASLQQNAYYPAMFKQAFPDNQVIDLNQVYQALAAFQSSLISLNSRYDHYVHGYHEALSPTETEGFNIFRSFVARCSECHTPPLFTNQQIAVIGTPEPEGLPLDVGAENTFHNAKLKGAFKVPTLRNIVKTAPYMHSGRYADLREAVDFYNKGRGHAVPKGVEMQIHWHIWEPNLSEHEIDLIVEFLATLTDESLKPLVPEHLPSGL